MPFVSMTVTDCSPPSPGAGTTVTLTGTSTGPLTVTSATVQVGASVGGTIQSPSASVVVTSTKHNQLIGFLNGSNTTVIKITYTGSGSVKTITGFDSFEIEGERASPAGP
jgi:hypothetical protein